MVLMNASVRALLWPSDNVLTLMGLPVTTERFQGRELSEKDTKNTLSIGLLGRSCED